ncbi:Lcl C-terminal domain-containing protein [Salinimonas sediminis]|uniref:DUF1566 domain-containing protein n=1 Tax=Salinimonas sediminis TaxID=2303538 RepID=A0A346NJ87_9ALTE|nr:DUF1566 domain-containing protein [Salinimonas sediminis]AXR05594.1 DUF1566 domain-containing protein [Salinimonas sediminis]
MKRLQIALLALFSPFCVAQYCLTSGLETTPDENLSALDSDSVLHSTTNLVWKRCAQGQTWDGTTCTGEAKKYSWQEALVAAHSANDDNQMGWRVPNIKELASITDRLCVRPAINETFFPATPPDDFWTSTPSLSDPQRAWVVAFFNSSHSIKQKDRFIYLRLVRTYTGS